MSPAATHDAYVFVGGVDVSYACLAALCEMGHLPGLAVGYGEGFHGASAAADLEPLARKFGFPLLRVSNTNDPAVVHQIGALQPRLMYVIGWSQLIHKPLLDLPTYGCVGIHPTKLPEGRGRAPIPWTILKGLDQTASTMFFLTEGVDDGDVIGQIELVVEAREDAGALYDKHRAAHVELVRRHHEALVTGAADALPQEHRLATYWPRRRPEDGRIDWARPVDEVDRLVRALTHPFPGAFTEVDGQRAVIWRAEPAAHVDAKPGSVLRHDGSTVIACGRGALRILKSDPPLLS